jgi:Cof subfamily protein (haloacid dehalogenase superfamily)
MGPAGASRTLLVSDLDGTLLRPDASLSATTARVVNDFVAQGGLFTYATARSYTTASRVTAPLDLRLPVITYGGAIVVDPSTGAASEAHTLAADVVEQVLTRTGGSKLVQPIVFAMHEGRDRLCWRADREIPAVVDFLRARPGDPRLLPLTTWSTIDPSAVFYISLVSDRAPLADLHRRLTELATGCNMVLMEDVYAGGRWWLELTAASATKAAAVAMLKARLGADTLVCVGDNDNDLPMLAIADIALAVANAAPAVRAMATHVIGANAADGVAAWISDYARPGPKRG